MSWAELAENDAEMQLMGPPPLPPDFVNPNQYADWMQPKRFARPPPPPPVDLTPFGERGNMFTLLSAAPETAVEESVKACWEDMVCELEATDEPSPPPPAAEHPSTHSARTDSAEPASSS